MTKLELVRRIKAVMDETGLHESEVMRLSRELDTRGVTPLRGGVWGTNSSKLGNFWRGNKHLLALDDQSTHENTLSDARGRETDAHTVPQERAQATRETPAHESIQVSTYADSTQENPPSATDTQEPTEYDVSTHGHTVYDQSAQPNTDLTVSQEHTPSHDLPCEMPAHNVIQLDPKDAAYLGELLAWWRERRDQLDTMQIGREERPAFKGPRDTTKTVRLSEAMARAAEKYAAKHRAQTGGTFSGLCEWLIWQALGRPDRFVTQVNTE